MHVHLLRQAPTDVQFREMLDAQVTYIKLAVDVEREVLAGGGEYRMEIEDPTLRARIERVVQSIFQGGGV